MVTVLRFLRLVSVVVWLGGLIFFAAVLAPTAFSPEVIERTGSVAVSALMVGSALGKIHGIGMVCGVVILLSVVALGRRGAARRVVGQVVAVAVMLLLTAYSQFRIIPRMERDRAEVGEIDRAPVGSAGRVDFERLHKLSEQVEGGVMLAGLGLVVLLAMEGVGVARVPVGGALRVE